MESGVALLQSLVGNSRTMGHNYWTYIGWGFIPPSVILLMAVSVISILPLGLQLGARLFKDTQFHPCLTLIGEKFPHRLFLLSALKTMYGHDVDEQKETGKIMIYGRSVGFLGQYFQFASIVVVFSCSAVAFWTTFLIDESDQCNPQMDCFTFCVLNDHRMLNPLENCTYYEEKNCTIECFKFSFQYADALGNSGGVLALSKVIVSLHATVWIAIASLSSQPRAKWLRILAIVYIFLTLTIAAVISKVFTSMQNYSSPVDIKKTIEFLAYTCAIEAVFLVSGPGFILTTEPLEDNKERTVEDDNERTGLQGRVNSQYGSIQTEENEN